MQPRRSRFLDQIPLFVKDGAIIPMMPAVRQTSEWNENTALEVRVYGEKDGSFELYDDDGKTFLDFKLDEDLKLKLRKLVRESKTFNFKTCTKE